MEREIAIAIAEAIRDFEKPVNYLTELSYKVDDETERAKLRRCVAQIMSITTIDLINLITAKHPDLDPYKDYFKKDLSK
jgi:hypothetical protein